MVKLHNHQIEDSRSSPKPIEIDFTGRSSIRNSTYGWMIPKKLYICHMIKVHQSCDNTVYVVLQDAIIEQLRNGPSLIRSPRFLSVEFFHPSPYGIVENSERRKRRFRSTQMSRTEFSCSKRTEVTITRGNEKHVPVI